MFTIILFIVAGYLTLKELGRVKGKFDLSRQAKIDRELEANDLAQENIKLQREILALKKAEFHQQTQDAYAQAHAKPEQQKEPGYRYVTTKQSVRSTQPQTQH